MTTEHTKESTQEQDLVILNEYLRRINESRKGLSPIRWNNVKPAIDRGEIVVEKRGIYTLIDYNKYKDFHFIKLGKR